MKLQERTQDIKAIAAEIFESLAAETLRLPMNWVAEQAGEPKIHRHLLRLTIGGVLKEVLGIEGNISKPYCVAVEAISTIFNANGASFVEESNSFKSQKETVSSKTVLGKGETPLFERILEAVNGAIYYMKNGGRKGSVRQAALIDHLCNQSGNYDITAKTFGYTRQNVELAVRKFNQQLREGKTCSGLEGLYAIDSNLLNDINKHVNSLSGRLLHGLKDIIGAVEGTQLDYILRMFDYEVATIGNSQFVIERGQTQPYTKIADTARRALSKSVKAIPFKELSEGLSSGDTTFLKRYLSIASGVKFIDGDNVIMTGKGLDKAVRQARIIYEAAGWISKADISARYEAEYGEPMGAFAPAVLHKLGCTNHNKLGCWIYGSEKVGTVKGVIQTIMTPEKPIATFSTILKAVRANGLIYPEETIRTCITDLACPENDNHDLFCLKGYTQFYANLSWRSYRKPA